MDLSGADFQSAAMIGGFFVAGFVVVWIFMTLRQGEREDQNDKSEGDRN